MTSLVRFGSVSSLWCVVFGLVWSFGEFGGGTSLVRFFQFRLSLAARTQYRASPVDIAVRVLGDADQALPPVVVEPATHKKEEDTHTQKEKNHTSGRSDPHSTDHDTFTIYY